MGAWLRAGHEILAPSLDRLGDVPECATPARELVGDANGWSGLYMADDEPSRFEILQPRREHLVAGPLRPLADFVEPQRSRLEHVQDERRPGTPKQLDRH